MNDENWEKSITRILYRPFDTRWIFYSDAVVDRTRKEVMQHMFRPNIGLLVSKQQSILGFHHAFVSQIITESCVVSNKTREGNYHFPLYVYPKIDKDDLFGQTKGVEKRQSNLDPRISSILSDFYQDEPSIEEITYYIYAVLYSNTYRKKYAEFLKIDFPRIPFTNDHELFKKLQGYGKRLVDLHLLSSPEIDLPVTKFQGKGDDKVEKVSYKKGNVLINKTQHFENISKAVWEYQIGGYAVCEKWLKDRKGRTLSLDDIKHYCKIVTALKMTIEIQEKIDKMYPEVEKSTVQFEG